MRIVIVTGLSGAGKSTALRALEDIGFYCTDNLPLPSLPKVVELWGKVSIADVAVSVDARQFLFLPRYRDVVSELREQGHSLEVIFLEAPDDVLIRRYSESRRRHPLSGDDLVEGIKRDRELLYQLREDAEVLNTAALNVHQLKGIVQERYSSHEGTLAVRFLSFGFKRGVPPEADVMFDVRHLKNPYFVEGLSGSHGRDPKVAEYVLESEEGRMTLEKIQGYLAFALPQFQKEGKLYLTVAIGCTGGRHRSVAMSEKLSQIFSGEWDASVRHRDLVEDGAS